MNVCILDFETTGVDATSALPIELGYQITSDDFNQILDEGNELLCLPSDVSIPHEVTLVTGITNDELLSKCTGADKVLQNFIDKVKENKVSALIAYNSVYDKTILFNAIDRLGLDGSYVKSIPFLCAMSDVKANYAKKCWKLSHLALDHGLAVDPSVLHRAVADVNLTRRMLYAIKETAPNMLKFNQEPWCYAKAVVEKPWEDGGKSTDEAKKAGYAWQKAKGDTTDRLFDKAWVKRVKLSSYQEELKHSFRVVQLT